MFFSADKSNNPESEAQVPSSTPFKKRLRWLMEKPPEGSIPMLVSPAMAEEMLTYNDRNRPVSLTRVRDYADQMSAGGWKYTLVPIIFSDKMRLIDGQHRLHACVASGVAIKVMVAFGAPDDSFYFIDVGGTRTASDIFAINGVANHAMAAAATRFLMSYEAGKTSGDNALGKVKPNLQDVYKAYKTYSGLQDSLKAGRQFAADRLPCPSIAAAVHYLCAQKSRKTADEYFDRIATGVGFQSKREPAYKIRDYLARPDQRLCNADVAAALIQGWPAVRTGKPLGTINTDKIGRVI